MDIIVSQEPGPHPVTVFRIQGDLTSAQDLLSKAQEAFDAGTRKILLDLTDVPYMSSSGLRALHSIFMMLRGESPDESEEAIMAGINDGSYTSPNFKLLKPSKPVLEVLKTAGYDMFLEIHKDYKKAIASF